MSALGTHSNALNVYNSYALMECTLNRDLFLNICLLALPFLLSGMDLYVFRLVVGSILSSVSIILVNKGLLYHSCLYRFFEFL